MRYVQKGFVDQAQQSRPCQGKALASNEESTYEGVDMLRADGGADDSGVRVSGPIFGQ
jgi:hypothetical protein